MPETQRKWENYQPTKTLWFWSCVAASVLTMIVGFAWGGWVTGGTAEKRIANAEEQAVAELASRICVHRFLAASDAAAKLAELKETNSWGRDDLVEKAGWVTFADMKEPVDGAANLCADKLSEMDVAAIGEADGAPRQIEMAN